jgi:hypothetical protein
MRFYSFLLELNKFWFKFFLVFVIIDTCTVIYSKITINCSYLYIVAKFTILLSICVLKWRLRNAN